MPKSLITVLKFKQTIFTMRDFLTICFKPPQKRVELKAKSFPLKNHTRKLLAIRSPVEEYQSTF